MKAVAGKKVWACIDCPHVTERADYKSTWLECQLLEGRAIVSLPTDHFIGFARQQEIPKWCPLPDAPGGGKTA
jgi:hypothetical protein